RTRQRGEALEEGDPGRPVPGNFGPHQDQLAQASAGADGELARDGAAGSVRHDMHAAPAETFDEAPQVLSLAAEAEVVVVLPSRLSGAWQIDHVTRKARRQRRQQLAVREPVQRPSV